MVVRTSDDATGAHGTYTALVVDDDLHSLEVHSGLLQWFGWSVGTAASGREAMHKAYRDPPDVILLDLAMGEREAVLRQVQGDERTRRVPIVALAPDRERLHDSSETTAGLAAVLPKPVETDRLIRELLAAMVRTQLSDGR